MAKPSSPCRTQQLYSSSSLQAVPGPPNHGPALFRGGLFGFDQNHANILTAHMTVALQDSSQSLPGPHLVYLWRWVFWVPGAAQSKDVGTKTRSRLVERGIVQIRQEVRGEEVQGGSRGRRLRLLIWPVTATNNSFSFFLLGRENDQ